MRFGFNTRKRGFAFEAFQWDIAQLRYFLVRVTRWKGKEQKDFQVFAEPTGSNVALSEWTLGCVVRNSGKTVEWRLQSPVRMEKY